MKVSINVQVLIRLFLIIVNAIIVYEVIQKPLYLTAVFLFLILGLQIYLFLKSIEHLFLEVEKSIDSLLHDDYSVHLSKRKRVHPLYAKTANLVEKIQTVETNRYSERLIFDNIIENLTVGILILRKTKDKPIEVFQLNQAFVDHLKIPKYYRWEILKEKIKPLVDLFGAEQWETVKHVVDISINEEKETFYLRTSKMDAYESNYILVSLETVQKALDKKEKEWWFKLMKVMSHEIMNTITPISSLAGSLASYLEEELPSEEKEKELAQGLAIIRKRSLHLTEFVNNYRKLAELPNPILKKENLIVLITETLELFDQEFKSEKVVVDFESNASVYVKIDRKLIGQVLINLITNSLYAVKGVANPRLEIECELQATGKVKLKISDNGIGIPKEIQSQIFIPYFTTRKEGMGIGLTLAKSIVEAHQGIIALRQEENKTSFVILLDS